jgi:hypothetical protein
MIVPQDSGPEIVYGHKGPGGPNLDPVEDARVLVGPVEGRKFSKEIA